MTRTIRLAQFCSLERVESNCNKFTSEEPREQPPEEDHRRGTKRRTRRRRLGHEIEYNAKIENISSGHEEEEEYNPTNNEPILELLRNRSWPNLCHSKHRWRSPAASLALINLMPLLLLLLLYLINDATIKLATASDYQGAYLGKLNSYAHQVNGDVYTIDEYTFLIKNFFYDGLSQDAFFWAGSSIRPSNKGFIIPSEDGRTNRLQRYTNRDITIRMPDDRRITSVRWLSVWDIRGGRNLGDIIIPEGFEPPTAKKISEFSQLAHGVRSETVTLINSRSIGIQQLYYDGLGPNTFFLVGIGPQASPLGTKVPDETGALEPLGAYDGEDIVLELPGNLTIFDIDWLAIYDLQEQENYGSVLIPSHLSVPPALVTLIKYESRLPQCEQLHRDIQLNWEIFGPQITFELVARIQTNDYIAFGISGSDNSSQMLGSDVSLSYLEGHLGFTFDYNITDRHPCVNLNAAGPNGGEYRGVCPDVRVGGVENYQVHTYTRENGLTKITFRRNLLNTGDEGDKVFKTTGSTYVIWAVGRLNKFKEPRYHHMYSKGDVKLEFGRKISKNCFQFTVPSHDPTRNANDAAFTRQQVAALSSSSGSSSSPSNKSPLGFFSHFSPPAAAAASSTSPGSSDERLQPFYNSVSWGQPEILNKSATTFYARLGHPGVQKGYMQITGEGSAGLVWYINGLMAPILHVQRGKTYTFRVEGGNSFDKSYRFYHPFYITDEPYGGYLHQNVSQRNAQKVLAGLQFERAPGQPPARSANAKPQVAQAPQMIGKPAASSVGRLCAWLPYTVNDIRKAETHQSFAQFRAKLNYTCAFGQPGIVQWTPNVTTPDVVYYQSYTQRNMGWKIIVRDDDTESE